MGKGNVVLLLGSGIFNEGPGFWRQAIPSFMELGYNIHLLKNEFRTAKFFQEPQSELSELNLLEDVKRMRQQIQNARKVLGSDKKYVFIGHSKAGLVGQVLAQEKLFDALIALAPAMPKGFSAISISSLWYMKSVLLQVLLNLSAKISVKRSFSDTSGGVLHPGTDKKSRFVFYGDLRWESGKVIWDLAFNKPQISPSMIKIPMLFIAAQKDQLVKAKTVQDLAGWYKKQGNKVKLKLFDDMAHYPTKEQIDSLVCVINNWLEEAV